MTHWKEVLRRFGWLGRRARFEAELEEEMNLHLEERAGELQAAGVPRREAVLQARREFGSRAYAQERTRAAWQFRWLEDLAADFRYAGRAFRRNPGFAGTAVVCLALGIGANTTIFSIAAEVLFSRPSVREPKTLVRVEFGGSNAAPLRAWRFVRDADVFDGVGGENEEGEVNWREGASTSRLYAVSVTDNFFAVTGIPVALGRPMLPRESTAVVVSYSFWQQRMGGDRAALGRQMVLDGKPYTIVGILPRNHRTVTGFGLAPDLYVPAGENSVVSLFLRMPPGMSRQVAYERLKATCQEMDRVYPDPERRWSRGIRVSAIEGMDRLRTDPMLLPIAAFFAMLMVVVGLVLLIACANVSGLLLARAASRSQEIAIRLAIGAARGRLVRQLLAESLLLAICGTAAGLALNVSLTSLVSRIRLVLPVTIQFVIEPDWRLLAYAAGLAVVASVASGLIPALRGTRYGISRGLKSGGQRSGGSGSKLRHAMVACQLAVSVVLLCAGFLFLRNVVHASTASPGFDLDHTIWASMRLVPERYPDRARTSVVVDRALERLRGMPGVDSASIARVVPLNGNTKWGITVYTDLGSGPAHVEFNMNYVDLDYFRVMQIPIVSGRPFLPSDRKIAPKVAVLNESLARRLFGNIDPTGHTIRLGTGSPVRIAGVAANSKYFTLGEENAFACYEPFAQWDGLSLDLNFLVRAAGDPRPLLAPLQSALSGIDGDAALEVKPMRNALVFALLPSRVGAAILGSMGLLGLVLASIGLYGVLLYSVSLRIREIGLRVALGATPASVLRLVFGQSAAVVIGGIAAGMALAFLAVRPLAMFLVPGVHPLDITNFVVVAGVLSAVGLAATAAPAFRALRVDPAAALRHE